MEEYEGNGSTLVVFDLYFDEQHRPASVLSPTLVDQEIRAAIKGADMDRRRGILDVWETKQSGPATSFHSLQESHVRLSVVNFTRTETWPFELHANGEAQLCNYSRDNTHATQRLVRDIIERLKPAKAHLMLIIRGPGPRPHILGMIDWKRGDMLPPFDQEMESQKKEESGNSAIAA